MMTLGCGPADNMLHFIKTSCLIFIIFIFWFCLLFPFTWGTVGSESRAGLKSRGRSSIAPRAGLKSRGRSSVQPGQG